MKITKTRLKQIIKEELQEYKTQLTLRESPEVSIENAISLLKKLKTSRPDKLERIIKLVQSGDYHNAVERLEGLPSPEASYRPEPGTEARNMLDNAVKMLDDLWQRGELKEEVRLIEQSQGAEELERAMYAYVMKNNFSMSTQQMQEFVLGLLKKASDDLRAR